VSESKLKTQNKDNQIGDEGAKMVANALKFNHSVQFLDLEGVPSAQTNLD
jgi:hypothetical protein